MTFEELRTANATRCEQSFHPVDAWTPAMWALAVAGEAGELCNQRKKIERGDFTTHEAMQQALQDEDDEIADIILYLDLLAARKGKRLDDIIRRKFNWSSERYGSPIKL